MRTDLSGLLRDLGEMAGRSGSGSGSAPAATGAAAAVPPFGSPLNPVQVYVQGGSPGLAGDAGRRGGPLGALARGASTVVSLSFLALVVAVGLAAADRSPAGRGMRGERGDGKASASGRPGGIGGRPATGRRGPSIPSDVDLDDPDAGAGAGGPGGLGIGSFAPKRFLSEDVPIRERRRFADVRGCDEAKEELREVVELLRDPEKFRRLGATVPKGVLLSGPPGTGKTLLAKAVAGEAGVPFFYRAGSEFEEMYVGVGARRVRSLFAAAKRAGPCIVFIDEIDAIGGSRRTLENQTSRKTLNQLLIELDGFDATDGVVVLAATNLADALDPALTRPGRFDRHVAVPLPDVAGRRDILAHLIAPLGKVPAAMDVCPRALARATPGFSGADLTNLVNEAAITAAKRGLPRIERWMLDEARDKISMGAARLSAVVPERERRNTAFHEAGHALVALRTRGALAVHRATIVPRGHALGMVQQVPDDDYSSMTREQMMARLDVAMGGRAAEELVLGHDAVSAGASNDLAQATRMARAMVAQYGLSDAVGPVAVDDRGGARPSEALLRSVEGEVARLLREALARARALLESESEALERLASALLAHETLTGDEVRAAADGTLVRAEDDAAPPGAAERALARDRAQRGDDRPLVGDEVPGPAAPSSVAPALASPSPSPPSAGAPDKTEKKDDGTPAPGEGKPASLQDLLDLLRGGGLAPVGTVTRVEIVRTVGAGPGRPTGASAADKESKRGVDKVTATTESGAGADGKGRGGTGGGGGEPPVAG